MTIDYTWHDDLAFDINDLCPFRDCNLIIPADSGDLALMDQQHPIFNWLRTGSINDGGSGKCCVR